MNYTQRGVIEGSRPEDYVAGIQSPLPYVVNVQDGNWKKYKPTPEFQNGNGDRFNCVSQSGQNAIKMLLNEQIANSKISLTLYGWLKKNNYIDDNGSAQFSVRFNTILNGTIPGLGNYLYTVGDDFRKSGLIPETMLADDNTIPVAEYFDKKVITEEMLDMGQEFLKRFQINYEWVNDRSIEKLQYHLKQSPPQIVINKGTHAVAEILQLEDTYIFWDSYLPNEKEYPNAIPPTSFLKYIITYKKTMTLKIFQGDQYLVDEGSKFCWSIPNPEVLAEAKEHFAKLGTPLGEPEVFDPIGYFIIHGADKTSLRNFFNL